MDKMSEDSYLLELYSRYKRWVVNNPSIVTDVETVVTWSSYFVAGKINKSPIVSELVYSLSKLLSLYNDKLIKEAYGQQLHYGLCEQIKMWLTVIHYCEVFVELLVKSRWGTRGKWTAATFLQIFKCTSGLVLLYRFRELPIPHPPIPVLQRKKFTECKDTEDNNTGSFFTLKRSGRIVRRIDGAPPVSLRDWQPIKIKDERMTPSIEVKDLLHAELLHILKPLIHLAAMRVFGTKAWKQWLIALGIDIASFKLYNRHMKTLSYEQRLEISRRKLSLILYFLRSPMYNGYSKNVITNVLNSTASRLPIMAFICNPIIQYLNHWQDIYFYMWAS